MLANAATYTTYRAGRDKGEFDEWADRQKPPAAPLAAPVQGPQRSAQECNGEAESLKLVRALWRTHLDHCMAGYRFTSAQQVQAIQNEKLMEMGRQITRAGAERRHRRRPSRCRQAHRLPWSRANCSNWCTGTGRLNR